MTPLHLGERQPFSWTLPLAPARVKDRALHDDVASRPAYAAGVSVGHGDDQRAVELRPTSARLRLQGPRSVFRLEYTRETTVRAGLLSAKSQGKPCRNLCLFHASRRRTPVLIMFYLSSCPPRLSQRLFSTFLGRPLSACFGPRGWTSWTHHPGSLVHRPLADRPKEGTMKRWGAGVERGQAVSPQLLPCAPQWPQLLLGPSSPALALTALENVAQPLT